MFFFWNHDKNQKVPEEAEIPESQRNKNNWLKKVEEMNKGAEEIKKAEEVEEGVRKLLAQTLCDFEYSEEGIVARKVLELKKQKILVLNCNPPIVNLIYFGANGFENKLREEDKTGPLDYETLSNFLYMTLEERQGPPTVDMARDFSLSLIQKIRKGVNGLLGL